MQSMIRGARRLEGFEKPTVWSIMTPLAIETKSVNLGQGAPAWKPPQFYLDSLTKAVANNSHQYTRAFGLPSLCNSIVKHHKRFTNLNPLTDILVTGGGVGGLFCCFLGLMDPGDEAILFDPSYDCYRAQIQMAGGKTRAVPLQPKKQQTKQEILNRPLESRYRSLDSDDWEIDWERLEKTLNEKTRVVLINTPHNPTGKVFTQEELERIASMLKKYPRVIVIEDNVYEGLTFDNYYQQDLPKFAFVKDMYDRTLSVYSGGKIFACTGSRVGWVVGPAHLVKPAMSVHQYNIFCMYDPVQSAMSQSLDLMATNGYMKGYADKLIHNRKILIDQLLNSRYDLKMWIPKGGYFIMTDISSVNVKESYLIDEKTNEKRTRDMAFCVQMAKQLGVVAIPCSSFYDAEDVKLGENMVRFAFCKEESDIIEAGKRISKEKPSL